MHVNMSKGTLAKPITQSDVILVETEVVTDQASIKTRVRLQVTVSTHANVPK